MPTTCATGVERHGHSSTPSLHTRCRRSCSPSNRGRVLGLARFLFAATGGGPMLCVSGTWQKGRREHGGFGHAHPFSAAVEVCRSGDADMQPRAVPTQRHACVGFRVRSVLPRPRLLLCIATVRSVSVCCRSRREQSFLRRAPCARMPLFHRRAPKNDSPPGGPKFAPQSVRADCRPSPFWRPFLGHKMAPFLGPAFFRALPEPCSCDRTFLRGVVRPIAFVPACTAAASRAPRAG